MSKLKKITVDKLKKSAARIDTLTTENQATVRRVFEIGDSANPSIHCVSMDSLDQLMTAAREEGHQSMGAVPADGVKILIGPNLNPVIKNHLVSLINLIDMANGVQPVTAPGDNDRG